MIQFLYFSKKNQVFQKIAELNDSVTIVTPSPAKADSLRSHLTEYGDFEVITIAKFTSDLLKKTEIAGDSKFKKKSDLLLIFAVLRGNYFPSLSFDQFVLAYDIFSDLRSFSTDFEIISTILNEFPDETSRPVKLLDKILNLTGFMDEHSAYAYLAQEVRSNETINLKNENIVFWGFSHLNGQQIDLLKALSLRNKIFIPLPIHLKNKFKRGDWVNWVRDNFSSENILDESELSPVAHLYPMNSREFSKNINDFIKNDDQIIIGVSKLGPEHVHLIPYTKVSYKIPVEFLKIDLEIFFQQLKDKVKTKCDLYSLESYLEEIKSESLKKIKVIQLYLDAIKTVKEFTDQNILIDEFFLKVLHLVVERNQPRLFLTPFSRDSLGVELKDFSSIDSLDIQKRTLICIDDRFDSIGSLSSSKYTETINSLLATVGPVKRADLDIEFKIWEIHSLMTSSEVHVFMTDESLKFNLIWKRFFSDVKFKTVEKKFTEIKLWTDDLNSLVDKSYQGNFSVSKMQVFLDCKRKFYFTYVDKKIPQIKLNNSLTAIQLGSLVHNIIEIFFKDNFNIGDLKGLTEEILNRFMMEENLVISSQSLNEYYLLCYQRALNGIQILQSVEVSAGQKVNWKMEQDFSFNLEGTIKGKIDCFGESGDYLFLFDFKSSATPSFSDFESFDNIQLWIYFLSLSFNSSSLLTKKIVLGFISLDNPLDSKIMAGDVDCLTHTNLNGSNLKIKNLGFNLFEKATDFREFASRTITNIKRERVFPANPRIESICTFCEINKICPKRSGEDV